MMLSNISCIVVVQAILETTRSYHNTGKEQILTSEHPAFNFTPELPSGSEACKGTAFLCADFKLQRFQQLLALGPQD